MASKTWLSPLILVAVILFAVSANAQSRSSLSVGFYSKSCPSVETIISATIRKHVSSNPVIAPKLLRMMFHDCFVQGCDASILLDGPNSEKTAVPNLSLRGFDAIEEAKSQLERACPGVVSCADILAIASRDAVVLTGGRRWEVPKGRKDGTVSLASNTVSIPSPFNDVPTQITRFNAFGLSVSDLVVLVGGHTIGTTACQFFSFRLYNFSSTTPVDPTINATFVPTLRRLCPFNGNASVRVALDFGSVAKFDLSYFNNLVQGRGILPSDQRLFGHPQTSRLVQRISRGIINFNDAFGKAMVKMSLIGVKTDANGQIRRVCNATN